MASLLVVTASSTSATLASITTVTTNLFNVPTGACGAAISIAGLHAKGVSTSANISGTVFVAQSISNPDIAGIGVIISFLATAYGIFIWMLVAYFCRWLPASLLGHVDRFIFKRPARNLSSPPWWQKAVEQGVLAYADLQIATGVGILTAAFGTMNTLSVYHLQVAIYLAWMSSNTHLTAVSLLQTDFRENKSKSIARRIRLGGMTLLGVMLLVALVPTTAYNWLALVTRSIGNGHNYGTFHETAISSAGIPAGCFWQTKYSGGLTPDAAWSFIILVLSYVWKGLLLFRPTYRFVKVSARQRLEEPLRSILDSLVARLKQTPRKHRRWLVFRYKSTLCLYLAVWALFELAQSFVISLWICGAGLVWGSFQILEPRRTLPSEILNSENTWAFGQILPVLLLAIPVLSFAEGYTIQKKKTVQKRQSSLKYSSKGPPISEETNYQRSDIESISHHTLDTAQPIESPGSPQVKVRPRTRPSVDTKPEEEETQGTSISQPPWRSNKIIYDSRFVRFSFWGSQIGILSLTALFIVFYFELFVPIGIPGDAKLQSTLKTDYGIWFIVGCTILGWLGMAVFLLIGGATFSSLFRLEDDASHAQTT